MKIRLKKTKLNGKVRSKSRLVAEQENDVAFKGDLSYQTFENISSIRFIIISSHYS